MALSRKQILDVLVMHPKTLRIRMGTSLAHYKWNTLHASQRLPKGEWPWRTQVNKSLPDYTLCAGQVPDDIENKYKPERSESFQIALSDSYVCIRGADARGLRYGLQCLKTLFESTKQLPCLFIEDWPSLDTRGVMVDLGRIAEKPSVIKSLIEYLAQQRANTLMLYLEDKIVIPGHKTIASPFAYSLKQIKSLAQYAAQYDIDLLPSFSLFGHATHILNKKKYAHLSDGPQAYQLNPLHKETKSLCVDHMSAWNKAVPDTTLMHMGCDETPYTGLCVQTKRFIQKHGEAEFFARHVRFLHKELKKRGQRMAIWGDMLRHHPDIIPLIPNDIIIYDWNYSPIPKSWAKGIRKLRKRGFEVVVVPAASRSAEVFMPDKVHHLENIPQFIEMGIDEGASGVLVSTWEAFNLLNTFSRLGYGLGMNLAWEGNCSAKNVKRLSTVAAESVFASNGQLYLDVLEQHGSSHMYAHFRQVHWDKKVKEKTYHLMSHEIMPTDPILYGTAAESEWTQSLEAHAGTGMAHALSQINHQANNAQRLHDMFEWYTMCNGIRSLPRHMYQHIHQAYAAWEQAHKHVTSHALSEALKAASQCRKLAERCLHSVRRWWRSDRYLNDYEFDRCFHRRWDWAARSCKKWEEVLQRSLKQVQAGKQPGVFKYYDDLRIHFVRMPHTASEVNILVIEVDAQQKSQNWDTFINLHAFQLPNTDYCYGFIAPMQPKRLRCRITRTQTPWHIKQLQWSEYKLPQLGSTDATFSCSEYQLGAKQRDLTLKLDDAAQAFISL